MRLVSFRFNGREGFGVASDDGIVDLASRLGDRYGRLRDALAPDGLAALREAAGGQLPDFGLEEVELLAPITDPDKILCIGVNYVDHRNETGRSKADYPTIFTRYSNSLAAHGQAMIKPNVSEKFDYEGELAVVIGEGGRHIAEDDAYRHIAGYACFNDGSIRDWQRHTSQFTPGKNFVASGGFGPWLVTADEIADIESAAISSRLNGEVMQSATIGDLIFTIPQLIHYISTFTELTGGDVIATGTPGGVGARRDPPVFMKPGDEIVVEIAGVGRLVNPIVAED